MKGWTNDSDVWMLITLLGWSQFFPLPTVELGKSHLGASVSLNKDDTKIAAS